MKINYDYKLLYIDLFCGAGGTTLGIEKSFKRNQKLARVIACVNHDPLAIASHKANHKYCKHFNEDIRTLHMPALLKVIEEWRIAYPKAKIVLGASLECTNFSKAKGGKEKNADSRTLALALYRYIDAIQPHYIMIENVVEFKDWGSLDKDRKPVKEDKGNEFKKWCNHIKTTWGYYDKWTTMNAADFGAYTSRNRLFGCFAKEGLPNVFPSPTHNKKGPLPIWKGVKDVLDFEDEGTSIFIPGRIKSDKTFQRILAGLHKHVGEGFIKNYKSGSPKSKCISLDNPCGTLTTVPTQAVVRPNFLLKYNSVNGKTGKYVPPSLNEPCPTVTTQGRLAVLKANFIYSYYGGSMSAQSVKAPSPTLTTKDRVAVVSTNFLSLYYSSGSVSTSIDSPLGTLTAVPKSVLISIPRCFVFTPQWGINCSRSVEVPHATLLASMAKTAPCIVFIEDGTPCIAVYESDSETVVAIKKFMAENNIYDIKMRLLKILELLKIQGFPETYILKGTQADQKKFIGNSVHKDVVIAWIRELVSHL